MSIFKNHIIFFLLFLLPSVQFFDVDNFYQVPIKNVFIFFILQVFLFFIFIFIVNIFGKKIYQKNWFHNFRINKDDFILIFILLYFLIFYFSELVYFFNKIFDLDHSKFFFLDALLAILIYFFSFYV